MSTSSPPVNPPANLPPGAQFLAAGQTWPAAYREVSTRNGTSLVVQLSSMVTSKALLVDSTNTATFLDPSVIDNSFWLNVAAGDAGFVATSVGNNAEFQNARDRCCNTYSRPYGWSGSVWFSPDGASWQKADLTGVVGQQWFLPLDVTATDGGFAVVGAIGPVDGGTASALLLTSADGISWTAGNVPTRRWPLGLEQLIVQPDRWVLVGREYVCDDSGGPLSWTGESGMQTRIWVSTDRGATWSDVDLAAAGVLRGAEAPPSDGTDCPTDPDPLGAAVRDARNTRFLDVVESVQAVGDLIVVSASDGEHVAVSRDLHTWETSRLPGAQPASPSSGVPVRPKARLVYSWQGQLVYVSLEPRRRSDNSQIVSEYRARTWVSIDEGASWELLADAGRSLAIGEVASLLWNGEALDVYTEDPAEATGALRYTSVAGPAVADTGVCEPAPGADCFVTTLRDTDLAGSDLRGIDLRSAALTEVDLSASILIDASMRDARLTRVSLAGADLTGADLTGARFADVDLTGVILVEARLSGAMFTGGICPDGAPPDGDSVGVAACRM